MDLSNELSAIFRRNVSAAPMTVGFGVEASFDRPFDIGQVLAHGSDMQLHHEPLHDFVQKHQVLRLQNAFVYAGGRIPLSQRTNQYGHLTQDPFHKDTGAADLDEFCLIMSKPLETSRHAPIYYAHKDDVLRATANLGKKIPRPAFHAVYSMLLRHHGFGIINREDQAVRQELRAFYPDFTDDVVALIPPDKLLRHDWVAGANVVMIHAAHPDSEILHARPHSPMDPANTITGRMLLR